MNDFVLDDFDHIDTADMPVIPPGGAEPIASITFAGPGHPKTIAQHDRFRARAKKRVEDQERARVNGKKWNPATTTTEQDRLENVQTIVERIVSWSGIKQRNADGAVAEVPFSGEVASALLLDPRKEWLLIQATEFLNGEQSFTKRSATA